MKIEIPKGILEKVMAESATFSKFYSEKSLNVEKNLLDKLWDFNPNQEFSTKIQRIKYLRQICEEDGSLDANIFRKFCQEKYREIYLKENPPYACYSGNQHTLGLLAAKKLIEYWFNC